MIFYTFVTGTMRKNISDGPGKPRFISDQLPHGAEWQSNLQGTLRSLVRGVGLSKASSVLLCTYFCSASEDVLLDWSKNKSDKNKLSVIGSKVKELNWGATKQNWVPISFLP